MPTTYLPILLVNPTQIPPITTAHSYIAMKLPNQPQVVETQHRRMPSPRKNQQSAQKPPGERSHYVPVPLRRWYLGLVLLYLLTLLSLLEYSFHRVPQVTHRRTVGIERKTPGHDSGPIPTEIPSTNDTGRVPTTARSRLIRRGGGDTYSNTTDGFLSANASAQVYPLGNQTSNRSVAGSEATRTFGRYQDPGAYPQRNPDIYLLRYRLVIRWIHHPNGRDIIPVTHNGMANSERCMLFFETPYITNNENDALGEFRFLNPPRGKDDPEYNWLLPHGDIGLGLFGEEPGSVDYHCHWNILNNLFGPNWVKAKDNCFDEEAEKGTIYRNPAKLPGSLKLVQRWVVQNHDAVVYTVNESFDPINYATLASSMPSCASLVTQNNDYTTGGAFATRTLSGPNGIPTATVTTTMPPPAIRTTMTLKDADWRPTATITSEIPLSAITTTLYSAGKPYTTSVLYRGPRPTTGSDDSVSPDYFNLVDPTTSGIRIIPLSATGYFIGSFFPVLLATLLGIPIQILNRAIRDMAPYRALALQPQLQGKHEQGYYGVKAKDSLLLSIGGIPLWSTVPSAWRAKDPLLILGDFLSLTVIVLIGLSSEGIGLTLQGGCEKKSFEGCFMSLAVVTPIARACEAIMAVMCVILGSIGVCMLRWRSGVIANPTSIVALARLLHVGGKEEEILLRELILGLDTPTREGESISREDMQNCFLSHRFAIEKLGCGIITSFKESEAQSTCCHPSPRGWRRWLRVRKLSEQRYTKTNLCMTGKKVVVEHGLGAIFFLVLCGLLIVVTYYGSVQLDWRNPFERFMDSQTVGVTFLFTASGSVVDQAWSHFFSGVEMLEPYRRLSFKHKPATFADLTRPRSSNAFSGFFRAAAHRDWFVGAVAFAGVLTKFLPICLSNIPFRLTLTWDTFVVCTWITVATTGFMMAVLLVSLFIRWPYLPVKPDTIAGGLYYLCDSQLLLEGLGGSDDHGICKAKEKIERRYRFGIIYGMSGNTKRIGIDYV